MNNYLPDEHLYAARIAEEAKRYEDMLHHMIEFLKVTPDIANTEHLQLLQVAFRNVAFKRRKHWRLMKALIDKNGQSARRDKFEKFKQDLEIEMNQCCFKVIDLVNIPLTQKRHQPLIEMMFNKIKADCYRYVSEYTTGLDRKDA